MSTILIIDLVWIIIILEIVIRQIVLYSSIQVSDDYRIVRCISRDFQTLIWALKTYLGLYTEYEMLIMELKLMINISCLK